MATPTPLSLETLVTDTRGGTFAFIRGHETKEGEVRDRKLQVGISILNAHERDLEALQSLDPVALAAPPDMVNPLVKQKGADPIRVVPTAEDIAASIAKRIESKRKSIAREHDRTSTLVVVPDTKGRLMRNPANPGTVLLSGLQVWRSGAEAGTEVKRTETVRNSAVTAVNAWITRRYEVAGNYRQFELHLDGSNFSSLVMGGEVFNGEAIGVFG